MNEVTRILNSIDAGHPQAARELIPLVYSELRALAARKMAQERPGQTLQATALVHEAYLRLVGGGERQQWNSRNHFFSAATEAMRRILVENARRKHAQRRGAGAEHVDLSSVEVAIRADDEHLLLVDEALQRLEATDAQAAELVKLRFFAGMNALEAAQALGLSERSATRLWAYARAWLYREIQKETND